MSYTAVESISRTHHNHTTMVDAMARPLNGWMHEPYAPRHVGGAGYYPSPEQIGGASFRLPPPSSLVSGAGTVPTPAPSTAGSSHDSPTAAGPLPLHTNVKPSFGYHDYQTPSPIQQTSPPLPPPTSQPHHHLASIAQQQGRRHAQDLARVSPTLSSSASDRSAEDFQDASRPQLPRIHQHAPPPPHALPSTAHVRQHNKRPSAEDHYSDMHPSKHHLPPSYPQNARVHHTPQPASPPSRQTWSPRSEPKTDRVKISDLLSSSSEENPRTNAVPKAPMGCLPSMPASETSEYRICVRQQPVAARSCGFGERDRRVIDPPPIVQLTIEDPTLSQEEIARRIRHPFSVVHCSIWNETGEHDNSAMPEDYRQQRRLMGTLVASPFVGQDENGEEGCFFCFPDLSCRTPGSFRLKFSLVVIDPMAGLLPGKKFPIKAKAMSDVFTVYNAKDFPGMQASTPLTKRLKEQGCLISIKKGNEKSSTSNARDESDEDESSGGRKKRSKKN